VAKDTIVSFDDVEITNDLDVLTLRQEMEGDARKIAAE